MKLNWRNGIRLLVAISVVWMVLIEPRWLAARRIEVPISNWQGPKNLKVAVAADWHLTRRPLWRVTSVDRAREIVQEINAAGPDLILLPGDFIADSNFSADSGQAAEEEIAAILGGLHAPYGVYAVLGNHDWWHNGEGFMSALRRHGISVLENEGVVVPGLPLWLVGVGDDSTGHSQPVKAMQKLPKDKTTLVMMHDPASLQDMPDFNGFAVAGHTHGGQVFIPGIGALVVPGDAPKSWAYGWVQHRGNSMYVTSGIGVSILPVRINMRPEWVLFQLQKK